MAEEREKWHSRAAFIMAAIGSAVGLGNVWRFPYITYKSGGGAFLIPYFVALFTAGIPMLILEMGLGQRMSRGAPLAFGTVNKKLQFFGWWAAGLSAAIVIYYCTILAWSWVYLYHSFGLNWSANPDINPETFFYDSVLHRSSGPGEIGMPVWPLVIGMALTWLSIYLILRKGVRSVSKVVLITVPLPVLLLAILLVRGITLPGAIEGIKYYLTPEFKMLLKPSIWLDAYGQIFFSLSLASGVMIGYGSYLGKKAEITNSAMITGLANCGTSFFAGFVVFSILGYLAQKQGVLVKDVADTSTGLAFVTFPTAISKLPFLNSVFGIIFFVTLLTLGIDSAFALQEAFTTGIYDKWRISTEKLARYFVLIAFPVSLIFVTAGGFYWFDIVDHWVCGFGLVISGLIQCIVIGYIYNTEDFRSYLNINSEIHLGRWWIWALRYVTPAVLLVILSVNFYKYVKEGYENYPRWATLIGGWGSVLIWLILGWYLYKKHAKPDLQEGE